jgi:LmbE family N-acetylglucosaminyl deacetylase
MARQLPDRIAVVSPHLDDGVLSLGAFIASATRAGSRVTIVTVFGGDPQSTKPAGGWDTRGGFATEGHAVRARRAEDAAACSVVGADPVWLSFSEADYASTRDEEAIRLAVHGAVDGVAALLLPGFPLTNPDHAFVTDLLVRDGPPCDEVGLYAEQPYRYWVRRERPRRSWSAPSGTATPDLAWTRLGSALSQLRTKRKAILEYRSQVPLLGLDRDRPSRLDRLLAHEVLWRGETVAWLPT